MQTMHRLMEMLSKANVNYSETNFDDKRDLEQLVHPYVCFVYLLLNQKLFTLGGYFMTVCQPLGFPITDICVCNGFNFFTISLL